MQELILSIARGLVEYPEQLSVTKDDEVNEKGFTVYHLHVAESDMGRVIGKQGRIAKAIRVVVRSVSLRTGENALVQIG